ncbi:MAG TPA: hypothetical protein VGN04_06320 [Herbaspirillum sp.]|jgi:hypothetical protein
MLLNDILLQNLSSLRTVLVDFLGPDIVGGMHKTVKMIPKLMSMKIHRHGRIFQVWEIGVGCLLARLIWLRGWRAAQLMRMRIKRTKALQQSALDAKQVLKATVVMADGSPQLHAVIEREFNSYALTISRQDSESGDAESHHRFQTIDEVGRFLEEKTVFRLGDFKSE